MVLMQSKVFKIWKYNSNVMILVKIKGQPTSYDLLLVIYRNRFICGYFSQFLAKMAILNGNIAVGSVKYTKRQFRWYYSSQKKYWSLNI